MANRFGKTRITLPLLSLELVLIATSLIIPRPFSLIFVESKSSLNNIAYLDPIEIVLIYNKPLEKLNSTHIKFKHSRFKNNHPFPDSEEMVAYILNYWSNEGDIVYDPFLGSGVLAEQAEKYKRKWIGTLLFLDR